MSWKTVRELRRQENFVGRQDQLRIFSENFVGDVPNYMVFSMTGEGGVGKSTLLQQYANIASSIESKAIVAMCDDRHTSAASVMGSIASQLAKREIRYKDFDERYKKYRELREEIESDPKAPRGAIDLLARGVTDLAIKSGRNIPGLGVFLEGADAKAAGERLAQLIDYGITRWGNKDEVFLLRETEGVLTPLFLELLAKATEHQKLVLMFDGFERTGPSLSPWLLALLNFEYGEFDTNLTFVISGRDPLEQHWTELAGTFGHIALEPFTLDETHLY
ncbi:MAG TPA: ATP-binding protein, partial [Candidatus Tectomicrobia bacterium]